MLHAQVTMSGSTTALSDITVGLNRLATGITIEINPRDTVKHVEVLAQLPRGTRVFVTRLPKGSFEETLAACQVLRDMGLAAVPHMPARVVESVAAYAGLVSRLVKEAGVKEILTIAGTSDPVGALPDTMPLFQTDVLAGIGLDRIFVAGHPEGLNESTPDNVRRALMLKNEFAARSGMAVEIATQFFFDAAPIIAWEKRIRAEGNRLPIHAGLHGVTGMTALMKHGMACGVGASLKVLSSKMGSLLAIASAHTPDELTRDIALAVAADPESLFGHAHLFPLGGLAKTVDWLKAMKDGRYSYNGKVLKVG